MTSREIAIVNWIACEGLDNSEWGVCTNGDRRLVQEFNVEVGGTDWCPKNFIYTWTDEATAKRMKNQLRNLGVHPDREYVTRSEDEIVLMFTV